MRPVVATTDYFVPLVPKCSVASCVRVAPVVVAAAALDFLLATNPATFAALVVIVSIVVAVVSFDLAIPGDVISNAAVVAPLPRPHLLADLDPVVVVAGAAVVVAQLVAIGITVVKIVKIYRSRHHCHPH